MRGIFENRLTVSTRRASGGMVSFKYDPLRNEMMLQQIVQG